MKKLLACMILCALLLLCGTTFVSAELPDGIDFYPGVYLGGDPDAFSSVGDITVAWRPNFASETDLTDGDLSDWYALDLSATSIDENNMIAWVGDGDAAGELKIISFCAADADYLYLAFDVHDNDFTYSYENDYTTGDAIQLSLDFGRKLGEILETDPDLLSNPKNTYYTFSCVSDGAPIRILRQESDRDGWMSEANGDGVKGAAKQTEHGWSAEIALSWQELFDDWVWRCWDDGGGKIYACADDSYGEKYRYLSVGASLYYLDCSEKGGDILCAAGVVREWKNDVGKPCISWTAWENGMTWRLPVEEGMKFNCSGIVVIPPKEETSIFDTNPPETEPPYDPPVEETEIATTYPLYPETIPSWDETIPPEVEETIRDAAEILETYGCTSSVGMSGLALLTTLAATALAVRKRR